MGTYRDNLSAIFIGDNLSPIFVIDQNSFNSSITDIALVKYFVITNEFRDKQFFMYTVFKVNELALRKKYRVSIESCCNLKNLCSFCLLPRQRP